MSRGMARVPFLENEKFDGGASTEDFDLVNWMYLNGKVAVLAVTTTSEPPPTTLKDLYYQRVRWYRGACGELFSKYFVPMFKAPIPFVGEMPCSQ